MDDGETAFIRRHLAPLAHPGAQGFRDDAAVLTASAGTDHVVTADMLVAGSHFLPDDDPADIAIKAITANLSDLTAKGADPIGYTVSLAFAEPPDDGWMAAFASGLSRDANGLLLGGDMIRGAERFTVAVTAFGAVPAGRAVRRSGAGVGDTVCLGPGTIGTSGFGLRVASDPAWAATLGLPQAALRELAKAYRAPTCTAPDRTARLVRDHASASMDVSDGLVIDLRRLCAESAVGARIDADRVPLHHSVRASIDHGHWRLEDALSAGDDYLVLFTAPGGALPDGRFCTPIGTVVEACEGVTFVRADGSPLPIAGAGGWTPFAARAR